MLDSTVRTVEKKPPTPALCICYAHANTSQIPTTQPGSVAAVPKVPAAAVVTAEGDTEGRAELTSVGSKKAVAEDVDDGCVGIEGRVRLSSMGSEEVVAEDVDGDCV